MHSVSRKCFLFCTAVTKTATIANSINLDASPAVAITTVPSAVATTTITAGEPSHILIECVLSGLCQHQWVPMSTVCHCVINGHVPTEAESTMNLFAARGRDECLICAISKKSGKRSCCARGGAWFKNCGDVGDIKFDHTWAEGMHICKGFHGSISVKSALKVKLPQSGASSYLLKTFQPVNTTQQQTSVYDSGSMSNVGVTRLWKVLLCICVFFYSVELAGVVACLS